MGCFELSDGSSNTWETNSDSADSANKHIKSFVSNQTLIEDILSMNPTASNIKEGFLLHLHLKELLSD